MKVQPLSDLTPRAAGCAPVCSRTPMALLTLDHIQDERNIDLTTPEGQTVATALIPAVIAWAEGRIGYPLEQSTRTEYLGDGASHFWLAPRKGVSNVVLASKSYGAYSNLSADAYEFSDTGEVEVYATLPTGMKSVRVTYTAGWTQDTFKTGAADLRSALLDLIALKLQAINSFSSAAPGTSTGEGDEEEGEESTALPSGPIKKLSIDGYSVEYSSAESDAYWKAQATKLASSVGDDVPAAIKEVVDAYRRPLAY